MPGRLLFRSQFVCGDSKVGDRSLGPGNDSVAGSCSDRTCINFWLLPLCWLAKFKVVFSEFGDVGKWGQLWQSRLIPSDALLMDLGIGRWNGSWNVGSERITTIDCQSMWGQTKTIRIEMAMIWKSNPLENKKWDPHIGWFPQLDGTLTSFGFWSKIYHLPLIGENWFCFHLLFQPNLMGNDSSKIWNRLGPPTIAYLEFF